MDKQSTRTRASGDDPCGPIDAVIKVGGIPLRRSYPARPRPAKPFNWSKIKDC